MLRALRARYDVDLDELRVATGFEFIALRDAAVEALLVDDESASLLGLGATRPQTVQGRAPRSGGGRPPGTVAVIRVLAERLLDLGRGERPDISESLTRVDALLDRSVGSRGVRDQSGRRRRRSRPLIDLGEIDFDALAARFAGGSGRRLSGSPRFFAIGPSAPPVGTRPA